jgi:hypothetical protein
MNWKLKCFSSRVLAALPQTNAIYDLLQKHVTKRWYRNVFHTMAVSNNYTRHLEAFQHHYGDLSRASYFEFGVARDLFSVLLNYCYGIPQQLAVDLRPLARRELINHMIRQLAELRHPAFVRIPERELGPDFVADLKAFYGIDYQAPADARDVKKPSGSIDLIATTNTFEHIPPRDIATILTECHRLCHDRSVVRMDTDYIDHYAYADPTISPYNFLQFTEEQWERYNMRHYYVNRLRHSDHRALFLQAGFHIVEESSETPENGREMLATIKLAPQYQGYDVEDLIKTRGVFVLRKQPAASLI